MPSIDGRPIGGKIAAMRCIVKTMKNPTIHGKPLLSMDGRDP